MDISDPVSCVSPGLHGRVLVVLVDAVEPLSGREVARRARASQRGVARVLNELVADGLVDRADHPPAALFTLNNDHLAAPAVRDLAGIRRLLYERIVRHVSGWDRSPVSLAVFGSYARGDGDRNSDIDILAVLSDGSEPVEWDDALAGLEAAVTRWTGNPARLITYTVGELDDAVRRGEALIDELRRDAITAVGTPIGDLVVPAARR